MNVLWAALLVIAAVPVAVFIGLPLFYLAMWPLLRLDAWLEARREREVCGRYVFPGERHVYRGILLLHWEVGRIEVLVGTRVEWWQPGFPEGFAPPGGWNDGGTFEITFEGTVSKWGSFGHRGSMRRTVEVHEVVSLAPS
jgi:hypothetical protein